MQSHFLNWNNWNNWNGSTVTLELCRPLSKEMLSLRQVLDTSYNGGIVTYHFGQVLEVVRG